jgi:hypothetical protein
MSLALLQCKQQVRVPRTSNELQLRIGIHTGSSAIDTLCTINHDDDRSTNEPIDFLVNYTILYTICRSTTST